MVRLSPDQKKYFIYYNNAAYFRHRNVFQVSSWDGPTKHGLSSFLSSIWKACKYSPLYSHLTGDVWIESSCLHKATPPTSGDAPKTEGAENCAVPRPQGWILQLIQKFLCLAVQFMNYLKQEDEKMAPTSSENPKKLSEAHRSPWQHLLHSVTEGCSMEAPVRCGAQIPAPSRTNPAFNPTAQDRLQSRFQILQRWWFTL